MSLIDVKETIQLIELPPKCGDLKMFPHFAADDAANRLKSDPKPISQLFLCYYFACVKSANFNYIDIAKFCVVAFLSGRIIVTTFFNSILNVVCMRPKFQMVRIAASRVVADKMSNDHLAGVSVEVREISKTVGYDSLVAKNIEYAVPVPVNSALPIPAFIGIGGYGDVTPKASDHLLGRLNCNRFRLSHEYFLLYRKLFVVKPEMVSLAPFQAVFILA